METVEYEVKYGERASRLELIIRLLWMIPSAIVLCVLGIIACIMWMLQWLHILVLAKRNAFMHEWMLKYVAYYTKVETYQHLLTDERNPLMPE
ncbi:MAG: DUF4389 domain-containing protein [Candidatus Micrarchaeia archaeon]|jgi:hypothetical protein